MAELKWRWAGHVARQDTNKWTICLVKWRKRLQKRSIGRLEKRYLDIIKQMMGRKWYQRALGRNTWRNLEEGYVQQWIKSDKKEEEEENIPISFRQKFAQCKNALS